MAQITIGDNISLTANGSLNAGYTENSGNQIETTHGVGFGGAAAFNGFYYNPNFISFTIDPYFNQSRSNANFASVTDASGVSLSSLIFGGSHFPGAVNYSANFNTTGNYGIPGVNGLNTNGNNQDFGINWGAYVPGWPTLTVGYQMGNSNYYLYGTNESGSSEFKSFHLNSTYMIAGFGLSGGIAHGTSNSVVPGVIVDNQSATSNSDTTTYSFTVAHPVPWSGTFSSSFNRTDLDSNYLGYSFNGSIDTVNANVGMHPTPKVSLSVSADYSDNLSGSLYEAIIPGTSPGMLAGTSGTGSVQNQSTPTTVGGGLLSQTSEQSSHAMNFLVYTTYAFAQNLQLNGEFERRQETYSGESFGSNLYDAGVIYTRPLAGGSIGASANIIDSTVDNSGQNELGFTVNSNYSRRIGAWQVAGYFSYSQNIQTYLITYNTSFYNYSANVSRRLGRWYFTVAGGGGHSGLTAQPDTSASADNLSATLGNRRFGFSAAYAKSSGNTLAYGTGLIPTPLPPIIPPNLLVLFNGKSYSLTGTVALKRNFNATASYVKSNDDLSNLGVSSSNDYKQINAYFQYQFRQLGLNGGYTRLVQGFSASPLPPADFNSFYIGVYRWFNFF